LPLSGEASVPWIDLRRSRWLRKLGAWTGVLLLAAVAKGQQNGAASIGTDSKASGTQTQGPIPNTQQSAAASQAPAIKLRVNLVQVKVVVRDEKGRVVKGLKPEDFQVYDQGKLQMISTFSVETPETLRLRAEAAARTQQATVAAAPVEKRGIPQRYVALVMDDVHLETWDVLAVRAGTQKLIESMHANDRIGIFSTSGEMKQEFTSDRTALSATMKSLASRPVVGKVNQGNICPAVNYYMADQVINHNDKDVLQVLRVEVLNCQFRNDPKMAGAAEGIAESLLRHELTAGNADNEATYRHVEEALRSLSTKPGERVMILVSPGFLLASLYAEETGLIEKANRAGIVINSADARGLFSPAAAAHDISRPSSDTQVTSDYLSDYRIQAQIDADSVLRDVAESTGGTFFHNSNDLGGGLQQLGAAPEASYLLGYSPFDAKPDGKFHLIKVVLPGHKNYAVQARHGYYAPTKPAEPEEKARDEIDAAVYSQDEIADMPLEIRTKYEKSDKGTTELNVTSRLGVKDVAFRKEGGMNCNKLTVTTVIFDENGEYVGGEQKVLDLRLEDDKFALVSRYGLQIQTKFALKPGSYTVREVVREAEGSQMAAKTGEVEIP
jgi:VWFA-related protein